MNGFFALGLLVVAYGMTVNKRRNKQIDFLTKSLKKKDKQIAILLEKLHELDKTIKSYER